LILRVCFVRSNFGDLLLVLRFRGRRLWPRASGCCTRRCPCIWFCSGATEMHCYCLAAAHRKVMGAIYWIIYLLMRVLTFFGAPLNMDWIFVLAKAVVFFYLYQHPAEVEVNGIPCFPAILFTVWSTFLDKSVYCLTTVESSHFRADDGRLSQETHSTFRAIPYCLNGFLRFGPAKRTGESRTAGWCRILWQQHPITSKPFITSTARTRGGPKCIVNVVESMNL